MERVLRSTSILVLLSGFQYSSFTSSALLSDCRDCIYDTSFWWGHYVLPS